MRPSSGDGGQWYFDSYMSPYGDNPRQCAYEDQTHAFVIGASTAVSFYYRSKMNANPAVALKECGTGTTVASISSQQTAMPMQMRTLALSSDMVGKQVYLEISDSSTGAWTMLDDIHVTDAVFSGAC